MDAKKRYILESLGYPQEILEALCKPRSAAMKAVDRQFLDGAKHALEAAGCSALELLCSHQGLSLIELSALLPRVNKWASPLGLTMAIYAEAVERGVLRETAKNLLIREILKEFPDGWFTDEKVHACVKIGSWDRDISQYVNDSRFGEYADRIVRHLTIDHPPREGWKPLPENDPLIDELFDRYWPIDSNRD